MTQFDHTFDTIAAEITELNDRLGRIVETISQGNMRQTQALFDGWPAQEMSDLIARIEQLEDEITGVRCRFDYQFAPTGITPH